MQEILSPTDKLVTCEFDRDMFRLTVLNERREEITITITATPCKLNVAMIRADPGEQAFEMQEIGEASAWTGLRVSKESEPENETRDRMSRLAKCLHLNF